MHDPLIPVLIPDQVDQGYSTRLLGLGARVQIRYRECE